ncbi:hypothetical protein BIV59_06815 [Bacillus sp. MUM 13]|nr:hypothetical protein BIV59_06815 [Bacillus sp. MUM 13]
MPQDAALLVFDPLTRRLRFFYSIQLQRLACCAKDVLASEGKERLPRPKPYLLRKLNRRFRIFIHETFLFYIRNN